MNFVKGAEIGGHAFWKTKQYKTSLRSQEGKNPSPKETSSEGHFSSLNLSQEVENNEEQDVVLAIKEHTPWSMAGKRDKKEGCFRGSHLPAGIIQSEIQGRLSRIFLYLRKKKSTCYKLKFWRKKLSYSYSWVLEASAGPGFPFVLDHGMADLI